MQDSFLVKLLKYIPSKLAPFISAFIAIPVLTRLFQPDEYAFYTLTMSTITVLTIISGWLPMSILRYFSKYKNKNEIESFTKTSFYFNAVTALSLSSLYFSILFLFEATISEKFYDFLTIGVFVYFVYAIYEIPLTLLRLENKINSFSLFSAWKFIGRITIGLVVIINYEIGLEALLWSAAISCIVVYPFLIKLISKNLIIRKTKLLNRDEIKSMFMYSYPLVIGNLGSWIIGLSDKYLINALSNSANAGIYSVNYELVSMPLIIIAQLIHLTAYPVLVEKYEKFGESAAKHFLSNVLYIYMLILLPAIIGINILSSEIVELFLGVSFWGGRIIFPYVSTAIFFLGLQYIFTMSLNIVEKTKIVMISLLFSGFLNILLNIYFIPIFGYISAAITTFISYFIFMISIVFYGNKFFKFELQLSKLIKISMTAFTIGIITFFVKKEINMLFSNQIISVLLTICFFVTFYLISLVIFRIIRLSDLKEM